MATTARFASDPISVVEARRLVERTFQGCPDAMVSDAALLTSELVSNAIVHARTPFEVVVDRSDGAIRVTVVDESVDPPVVQTPTPDGIGGRGLVLVSRVAHRWGYEPRRRGKAVWFEFDT